MTKLWKPWHTCPYLTCASIRDCYNVSNCSAKAPTPPASEVGMQERAPHIPIPWKSCPNIMCERERDCMADRVSWDGETASPCYAKRPTDPLELSKAVDIELAKMGRGPTGKEISRRFKEEQNARYGKVGWGGYGIHDAEHYRKVLDDVAPIPDHMFFNPDPKDPHLALSEELAREIPFHWPTLPLRYRIGIKLAEAAATILDWFDRTPPRVFVFYAAIIGLVAALIIHWLTIHL